MKRRTWDAQTEVMIVIKGLQGMLVAELCAEHQIRQSLYDQWHNQFLAHAAKTFDNPQRTRNKVRPTQENVRLKQLVGKLSFELKKGTSGWPDAAPVFARDPAR